ncbi:MAG: hypothetical protein IJN96_07985 [Clostridia bacterium]|nr:hypothetical protein [Clostridia bacterium]
MANLNGYNSSNAYKLDYQSDRTRASGESILHEKEQNRKNVAATKTNPAKSLANFLKVALCFAVAFAIINGYVNINEANNELAGLEDEYNEIVASNQDLQMKIDKAVDLADLQTVANAFGMVRPENYQMIYVDMEQDDLAETPVDDEAEAEDPAVKGVAGSLTGTLNIFN